MPHQDLYTKPNTQHQLAPILIAKAIEDFNLVLYTYTIALSLTLHSSKSHKYIDTTSSVCSYIPKSG